MRRQALVFNNEDGENRQDILSKMSGSEEITVEKYTYNGEPAAYCYGKVPLFPLCFQFSQYRSWAVIFIYYFILYIQ